MSISLSNILADIPKSDTTDYRSLNRSLFSELNKACIVIDDDPTGNQTVHGIPLLSNWSIEVLVNELKRSSVFYLLTNSRSLSPEETSKVYKEVAQNIYQASKITQIDYTIVSRSDSTLRGHFPLEPSTLQNSLGMDNALTVFIPVMFEGKRVTINNTHFIKDEDALIPVSETPFAQDHSFKYSTSNLKEYIQEKSDGSIKASSVISFSLHDIREKSVKELATAICELPEGGYCVFDSVDYTDLDKVTNALLLSEKRGKQIIYRTSSSFVPSYIGLERQGLLSAENLMPESSSKGGLTIVGSYVKKSSDQLREALQLFDATTTLEIDVEKVLSNQSEAYLNAVIEQICLNLNEGKHTIVFTSRKLITGGNTSATINIAATISNALVSIVKGLHVRPRYIIAKGGITSHDLAIKGLEMNRSTVIGQIYSGIPVWKMDEETKFPNLPYIVFPGNVGTTETLKDVIIKLNYND